MTERSRRQKRRQKIARNPKNIRFEELSHLLEDYGFELKRSKGSHHSFVGHIGDQKTTVVIPFRRPLQQVYVELVLALIDEIEPLDDNLSDDDGGTPDDEDA